MQAQAHRAPLALHRDDDKIPHAVKAHVASALEIEPVSGQAGGDARELRLLDAHQRLAEQLVADLQAWLKKAEESGIAALQEFACACAPLTRDRTLLLIVAGSLGDPCGQPNAKRVAMRPVYFYLIAQLLLQFRLFVGHVLACLRIELHQLELFRRRLLVLVGRVEVTRPGARFELDLVHPAAMVVLLASEFAARAQVGDDLLDADLVDQTKRCVADAQAHPAVLASTQNLRYCRLGRKRRFVLLFAWDVVPDHRALARD